MTPIVQMVNVSKRFGAVQALDSVSLTVEKGTIHAIVGENGAGKTTLMRILYGATGSDGGTIRVDGRQVEFQKTADAISHRIGMVSQHYSIIPELSCLENLILGAETGPLLQRSSAKSRASDLARKMGFQFSWDDDAAALSPAGAQKLEILKLLWREAEIMILDEPTAMLSPSDSDALFESLKQLTAQGATILLVTHRLPEVMEHCDRTTVLRGGKLIGDLETSATSPSQLAEMIVGHALDQAERGDATIGAPMLEVSGLKVKGARGEEALKGVHLTVRSGEMVGIAGVDGSGQRELFEALVGVANPLDGAVSIFGRDSAGLSSADRIALGLRLIPEDRHRDGVMEEWSLEENGALGLQRLAPIRRGRWVDLSERKALAGRIAERFRTKHGGLHLPMRSLSGGNQQRFVAARALQLNPQLILAFQPTRGLDIDGTQQVYAAIRQECRRGAGALIVSFDLDELLEECDRVVAMNLGELFEPKPGEERDRTAIGRLMVGAA